MSVSVIPESAICTPYMFVSMINMPFDLPESAICTPFLHGQKQSNASIDNDGANCTPYMFTSMMNLFAPPPPYSANCTP